MSRAFRLGIFIVGALLALGVGIFLIGNHRFLFTSTYRLRAEFSTVSGLDNGAEVRVGGINEGTVAKIILPANPKDKVVVLMDVKESTKNVIKKDSVASIQTEGLIGNQFVTISFGSPQAPGVKDGDTIEGTPPVNLSDLIKKADDILNNTQSATKSFNDITQNMDSVTSKINSGKGMTRPCITRRSRASPI
jgi:phospholipid/cholesterol/gamma-HCH transport system substrate-binding protein